MSSRHHHGACGAGCGNPSRRKYYSAGSISSQTREEIWELSPTGNWGLFRRDLNGDTDFIDRSETDEERTRNTVNELTDRDVDTDDDGQYDDTHRDLVYDDNGNLEDDDELYKYVWDAFNRLVEVRKTSTSALVAEFEYNGLHHRISSHESSKMPTILHSVS